MGHYPVPASDRNPWRCISVTLDRGIDGVLHTRWRVEALPAGMAFMRGRCNHTPDLIDRERCRGRATADEWLERDVR